MTKIESASLLICSGALHDLSELSKDTLKEHLKVVEEVIEKIAVKYLKIKQGKIMIKIIHTHNDGTVCLEAKFFHTLTDMQMLEISGQEYALVYMNYTGSYYVYNPITGREVATISKEFYESIKHFKIGNITPDPNCVGAGVFKG